MDNNEFLDAAGVQKMIETMVDAFLKTKKFSYISETFNLLRQGIFSSNNSMFNTTTVKRTDDYGIEYLEFWFLINATYDDSTMRFNRVDITRNSFGIQLQGKGTYPGEAAFGDDVNQGIGFWRATGTKYFEVNGDTDTAKKLTQAIGYDDNGTWRDFGVYVGWNNCFMMDSYGGMTIGGAGFEIDGNGFNPYGRISLSKFGGGSKTSNNPEDYLFGMNGICWNAFHQLYSSDDINDDSYFFGLKAPIDFYQDGSETINLSSNKCSMKDTSLVFMRRQAGSGHTIEDWKTVFEIKNTGDIYINEKRLNANQNEPIAVECQILDEYSFQVNGFPEGYDKLNSILIANKTILKDGSIKNISINNLTYSDYGILGIYSGAEMATIDKLFIYLKKVDPITL